MRKIKWLAIILAMVTLLATACGGEYTYTGATQNSYIGSADKYTTTAWETEETKKETQQVQSITPIQAQNQEESKTQMVWIPKTGKKYHASASCSGMKDPSRVTITQAKNMGYTACKKCW